MGEKKGRTLKLWWQIVIEAWVPKLTYFMIYIYSLLVRSTHGFIDLRKNNMDLERPHQKATIVLL